MGSQCGGWILEFGRNVPHPSSGSKVAHFFESWGGPELTRISIKAARTRISVLWAVGGIYIGQTVRNFN